MIKFQEDLDKAIKLAEIDFQDESIDNDITESRIVAAKLEGLLIAKSLLLGIPLDSLKEKYGI